MEYDTSEQVVNADIWKYANSLGCKELHFIVEPSVNLKGIIAIHNTTLGPALGGCRWLKYTDDKSLAIDAIRLAKGMSYKAALAGLPFGGGKAVLMLPEGPIDKDRYFTAFAKFVDKLQGKYITAVDSGTSNTDMDIIARTTKYVTSTSKSEFQHGNPSPLTAFGVLQAIKAAVKFKLNKDHLHNLQASVLGAGQVGFALVQLLRAENVKVTVFDKQAEAMQACKNLGCLCVVDELELYKMPSDIFIPCALGGVLNADTIPLFKAPIIVGGANNQLKSSLDARLLDKYDITYVPDFVANAGGLIYVCGPYMREEETVTLKKIANIYDSSLEILTLALQKKISTHEVAVSLAEQKIAKTCVY